MITPERSTNSLRCAAIAGAILTLGWLLIYLAAEAYALLGGDENLISKLLKAKAGASWVFDNEGGLGWLPILLTFVGINAGVLMWLYKNPVRFIDFMFFSPFDDLTLTRIPRKTGLTPWVPLDEGTVKRARDSLRDWVLGDCDEGDRNQVWWPSRPKITRSFKVSVLTGPNCVGKSQLVLELACELAGHDSSNRTANEITARAGQIATMIHRLNDVLIRFRLAFWWTYRKICDPWDSGLVSPKEIDLEAGLKYLDDWRPRRPSLLVLDDPRYELASKVIGKIERQKDDYWFPVRLLIVDQMMPSDIHAWAYGPKNVIAWEQLGDVHMVSEDIKNIVLEIQQTEVLSPEAFKQLWSTTDRERAIQFTDGNPYLVALLLLKLKRSQHSLDGVVRQLSPDMLDSDPQVAIARSELNSFHTTRLIRGRIAELIDGIKETLTHAGIADYEKQNGVLRALACATLAGGIPLHVSKDTFFIEIGRELVARMEIPVTEGANGKAMLGPILPRLIGTEFIEHVVREAADPSLGAHLLKVAWHHNPQGTVKTLLTATNGFRVMLVQGLIDLNTPRDAAELFERCCMFSELAIRQPRIRSVVTPDPQLATSQTAIATLAKTLIESLPDPKLRELLDRLNGIAGTVEADPMVAVLLMAAASARLLDLASPEKNARDRLDYVLAMLGSWLPRIEDRNIPAEDAIKAISNSLEQLVICLVHAIEDTVAAGTEYEAKLAVAIHESLVWPLTGLAWESARNVIGKLCSSIEKMAPERIALAQASKAWLLGTLSVPNDCVVAMRKWFRGRSALSAVGIDELPLARSAAWAGLITLRRVLAVDETLIAPSEIAELTDNSGLAEGIGRDDYEVQLTHARIYSQLAFARNTSAQATEQAVLQVEKIVGQDTRWASDRDMQYERARAWSGLACSRKYDPKETRDAARVVDTIAGSDTRWASDCGMQFVRAMAWRCIAYSLMHEPKASWEAVQRVDEIVTQDARWVSNRKMQVERVLAWCSFAQGSAANLDSNATYEAAKRIDEIVAQHAHWAGDREMQISRARAWSLFAYTCIADPHAAQQAVQRIEEIVGQDARWASDRDMQYERAMGWRNLASALKDEPQAARRAAQRVEEIIGQVAHWADDRSMQFERVQAWCHVALAVANATNPDSEEIRELLQRVEGIVGQDPDWAKDHDMQVLRAEAWCCFARTAGRQAAQDAVREVDEIAAQDPGWSTSKELQLMRAQCWVALVHALTDDLQATEQAVRRVDEIVAQDVRWACDRAMQLQRARAWRHQAYAASMSKPETTRAAAQRVDEIVAQDAGWKSDRQLQLERASAWCFVTNALRYEPQVIREAVHQVEQIVKQDARWASDRAMQFALLQAWCSVAYAFSNAPNCDSETISQVAQCAEEIVGRTAGWANDRDIQFKRAEIWSHLASLVKHDRHATRQAVQRVEEIVGQNALWARDRDMQFMRVQSWRSLAYALTDDLQATLEAVQRVEEIVGQDTRWASDRDMQFRRAEAWRHLAYALSLGNDRQGTQAAVTRIDEIVAQNIAWVDDLDLRLESVLAREFFLRSVLHHRDLTLASQCIEQLVELCVRPCRGLRPLDTLPIFRDCMKRVLDVWSATSRSKPQALVEAEKLLGSSE